MKLRGVIAAVAAGCALFGSAAVPAAAAPAPHDDIVQRLQAIPGMHVVGERPTEPGFRFFDLTYTQPVDHRDPQGQKFEQRLTLLHKDVNRPTVLYTTGYNLSEKPKRSEPTRLLDGNQVDMEYRFFEPSRPQPADWSKAGIWQGANDEHRVIEALKGIYDHKWITTGASKGGMTATYHRRFFPDDVDGTVAYVAPNDVNNEEDRAYNDFFANVGTPECRASLANLQREVLVRRDEMVPRLAAYGKEKGLTFTRLPGGVDQSFEATTLDTAWSFWQYQLQQDCPTVPAANAPTDAIWDFVDKAVGWDSASDQGFAKYQAYNYQAATELGWAAVKHPHLDDLLRYDNDQGPRAYLPEDIPVRFDPRSMRDVDQWVRTQASQVLFVNGQNDPWGAEPFRLGAGAEDSAVHVVPGGNHGSNIEKLPPRERDEATAMVKRWGGVTSDPSTVSTVRVPALDDQPMERHPR